MVVDQVEGNALAEKSSDVLREPQGEGAIEVFVAVATAALAHDRGGFLVGLGTFRAGHRGGHFLVPQHGRRGFEIEAILVLAIEPDPTGEPGADRPVAVLLAELAETSVKVSYLFHELARDRHHDPGEAGHELDRVATGAHGRPDVARVRIHSTRWAETKHLGPKVAMPGCVVGHEVTQDVQVIVQETEVIRISLVQEPLEGAVGSPGHAQVDVPQEVARLLWRQRRSVDSPGGD